MQHSFSLRVAGPTLLVSLLLLGLCGAAATFLYYQQATSAEILGENVSSSQAAHDLENTLDDLVSLLSERNEQVGALHKRIRERVAQAADLADKPEEKELVGVIEASLERYFRIWDARSAAGPGDEAGLRRALRIVQTETLPACKQLQEFNGRQIRESEAAHRQTVRWTVLGLVGVGTVGSVAGLVLGYGVARGVRRSIYQLSIHLRDAADKLDPDLPAVLLTEEADFHHLQQQMQHVAREVAKVVERLQQREREVRRAEQLAAVGQLAAGVAHELRNPLTSIKMLVQATREEVEAQGLLAEDLHVIELEIRRMERSLQTFLDFARPPKPACRPADLAQLVGRTLALIGSRARKQHVEVYFTPPEAPVIVEVDADQVQQVLVNLTLNALDAMPQGGALTLDLRLAREGEVVLCVLDTGPGIAPDVLPQLFQPFVSSKETGLGLGLVIARRIAESHGGSLRAVERPEGGACFALRLPVAVPAAGLPVAVDGGA